jgi:hypothetical protein
MAKLTKPQMTLLTAIVAMTNETTVESEMTFEYVSMKNNKPLDRLLKDKLVMVNTSETNDEGHVAARATAEGVALIKPVETAPVVEDKPEIQPELPTTKPVEDKPVETPSIQSESGFELETGIAIPKVKRGGKGRSKYPFDELAAPVENEDGVVYASFHIAPTEKMQNPNKSMASVVTSANKRYENKQFIVRQVDEKDPKGVGARVFRVK